MIARLRGSRSRAHADGLVLDVGGVGYLVQATPRALAPRRRAPRRSRSRRTCTSARTRSSSTASPTPTERELFEQLLSRLRGRAQGRARDRLRARRRRELRRAIALEDTARFEAIPGHRQEDGAARRARAEGEARLRVDEPRPSSGGDAHSSRATPSSSSATRSSTPSAALADVDPELPAEERVRLALRQAA